jgi:hypothetical protein
MLPGFISEKLLERRITRSTVYYNDYEKKSSSLVMASIYPLKDNNNFKLHRPRPGCDPCTRCDPHTSTRTCYDLIPGDGPLEVDTCSAREESCIPTIPLCPPSQWHCDDGTCCAECRAEDPWARCCRQVGKYTQCKQP